ncbi:helix-turn-helix transcriptional regulator [Streptomyces sp. NBC_01108]|uniref:helix-turn-helix transcriptional regulator n=1 Tax=Streptomyces sp. NBC_01108 TaxID=2903751 RepID=UPI003873A72C|nr:helix-turn-helix transcriptional regulator [Streptomyces sp. NBC_01108]
MAVSPGGSRRSETDAAAFTASPQLAIQARRTALGLSQTDLAQLARTTQAQVSRIERGAITPTLPVLERLARALDADLEVTLKAL